jgi:hypothetical protein
VPPPAPPRRLKLPPKLQLTSSSNPQLHHSYNRLTSVRSHTKCQLSCPPGHTFFSALLNLSPCNYAPCPPFFAHPIQPVTHFHLVAGFSEASPRYMTWTALSLVKHPKQTLLPPIPAASRWPTNLATYTRSYSSSEWPCCIQAQSPRSCVTT